jgi:hypothetical protein
MEESFCGLQLILGACMADRRDSFMHERMESTMLLPRYVKR